MMKFKSFEIYVDIGDFNASRFPIEQKANERINAWLADKPNIKIHHFAHSLTELRTEIFYLVAIFYSEE